MFLFLRKPLHGTALTLPAITGFSSDVPTYMGIEQDISRCLNIEVDTEFVRRRTSRRAEMKRPRLVQDRRYPKAWKLREEHKSDVLHKLEQIYGSTDSTKPFEERIIEISDQLAADAYTELQIDYPDLQDRIGFDKLSEQDFALCLKKLISESVSFTILSACGIEISDHEFSFDYINQFVFY